MIDLPAEQLDQVRRIVRQHLPDQEVFAFGSRVRGKARKFSDLDLMIRSTAGVPWKKMADLRESFEESDLPITVDVVDWSACSDDFRRVVAAELVRLV